MIRNIYTSSFKNILGILLIIMFFNSCSTSDPVDSIPDENIQWTVPVKDIKGSFNPFLLALNPTYSQAKNIELDENVLVAVVLIDDIMKVYPYNYISKFEVINDATNEINFAMTYCPITKSGICLNRNMNSDLLTLRASGYLYNENLVPYDEKTDTYWSQMHFKSIRGKFAEQSPSEINVIETTFGTVKNYFPESLVFTASSISDASKKIEDGNLVYGIISDLSIKDPIVSIFSYKNFGSGIKLYQKTLGKDDVVIIGSEEQHFISSYFIDKNSDFTAVQNEFPIIMKDEKGNKWNVFGNAVSGPDKGDQLKSPKAFFALWWAWQNFYTDFVFED